MSNKKYSILLQIKSDITGLKEATQAINKAKDQVNLLKDTFTGGLFNIGAGVVNAFTRGLSKIPATIAACVNGFAEQEQGSFSLKGKAPRAAEGVKRLAGMRRAMLGYL